jgi:WD40 repeat protein
VSWFLTGDDDDHLVTVWDFDSVKPLFSIHAHGWSMCWLSIFNDYYGRSEDLVLATFGDLELDEQVDTGGLGKGGSVFIWKIGELPISTSTPKVHCCITRMTVNTPGPAILDWSVDDESRIEFPNIPSYSQSACQIRVQYTADERVESMFFYKSVLAVLYSGGSISFWDINSQEEIKSFNGEDINMTTVG